MNSLKKKTIVFTIELSQRELDGKVYLALEAVKRGYRAFITDFDGACDLTKKYKSNLVVFHKGYAVNRVGYSPDTKHSFVCLDEEFGPAIPRNVMKYVRVNRKARSKVHSLVFAASDHHAQILNDRFCDDDLRIVPIGWPKLDMYSKLQVDGYHQKSSKTKSILFASSFGSRAIDMYLRNEMPSISEISGDKEYTQSEIQDIRATEKLKMLQPFIDGIKAVSHDYSVVLRPHNSERLDLWREIAERAGLRLTISKDEALGKRIKESVAVVHGGSTVGIQAVLMKVPVFMINPLGTVCDTLMHDVSYNLKCPNELPEAINELTQGENEGYWRDVQLALSQYMPGIYGKNSSEIVMDAIDGLDVRSEALINFSSFDSNRARIRWFFRQFVDVYALRKLFGVGKTPRVFEKLQGGIKKQQVLSVVDDLMNYSIEAPVNVLCSEIAPNIILFETE
jgi:surface carbohydrate biosynthesis protein